MIVASLDASLGASPTHASLATHTCARSTRPRHHNVQIRCCSIEHGQLLPRALVVGVERESGGEPLLRGCGRSLVRNRL